ncbi:unnamed protein product [Caenorhabditis auriculariae]|uniref:Lebercilin domain-containing protein n=1 Tax=Caenorhabditis auriculariae TaxID=2777116 RepID=A0A8S1HBA5_9PELO|nr:unnamed protein product [Caenorhabditis auriculariae]
MPRSRTRSTDRDGILPPAIPEATRNRVEALRQVYGRPTTAHRNSRPTTSSFSDDQILPEFISKSLALLNHRAGDGLKRAKSATRTVTRASTTYGRSASQERMEDLRQELFEAKKHNSKLAIDKKKLQTHLQKLTRESERREQHLQRLISGKFQPAEVNDTQMAHTLTILRRSEMGKEQVIKLQAQELELAKAYADQNAKLKERLKDLKKAYDEASNISKERQDQQSKAHSSQTAQQEEDFQMKLKKAIEKIKAEREETEGALNEEIREMHQQLGLAYTEIDNLRLENNHLQEIIKELESRLKQSQTVAASSPARIEIPKLDMTQMDAPESVRVSVKPGSQEKKNGEEKLFEPEVLAMVVAEIGGAHVERLILLEKEGLRSTHTKWSNKRYFRPNHGHAEVEHSEKAEAEEQHHEVSAQPVESSELNTGSAEPHEDHDHAEFSDKIINS